MENLERKPFADERQRRAQRIVVPLRHDDARVRAVHDIHLRVEGVREGDVGGRLTVIRS